MAVKDDNTLITKGDLKKFYNKILPYMGGNYVFNTLGTKDYYSEDEKIVGVWTDGKPLYRKVVTGNITASNQSLFKVNENVDAMVSIQGYTNRGIYYFPFNFTQDGSTQRCVFYKKDIDSIEFRGNEFISGETFTVILEYTKTTDAVNSAVDTIGCYDITRPDLWPENKEITFGNGLYGQRFTGNVTHTTTNTFKDITLSTTKPSTLISSGGNWYRGTNNFTMTIGQTAMKNTNDIIFGSFVYTGPAGLCVRFFNNDPMTSTYDIWVKYTK